MSLKTEPLPRELMESYLATSQEATMQGFSDSVLASAITPFVQRMMDTCYRMGYESGWRVRERLALESISSLILEREEAGGQIAEPHSVHLSPSTNGPENLSEARTL